MMKNILAEIHERALAIRWQHQTTDLAVIEQAVNEGVQIALTGFAEQVRRETKAMKLKRERLNAHQ